MTTALCSMTRAYAARRSLRHTRNPAIPRTGQAKPASAAPALLTALPPPITPAIAPKRIGGVYLLLPSRQYSGAPEYLY